MSFVKFEKVSLGYNSSQLAIKEIDFSIEENEFVALVGPSGCGKSTFMKLTSGLISPTEGYVFVNNREVAGPQKCVGMAFQASNLLPWRTTLENVMLPMEIVEPYRSTFRAKRREYEQQARDLLKRVGLSGCEHKYPWELSGGMQQRASICRALIHKPRLLMLDEPFGALDAFTREELWCMVRDLWQEEPFTVVLVTHDLREAVFLADTVYVMSTRPGQILARREIDLPRPRDLQITYTDTFSRYVFELREHISSQRHT
ncbi:nitrate ABC transporter ATP-binding protein [Pectobacterium actinidiae]|uniref:ABC transporter ATP-binding protein n=1 Tax=Pectobacterium actinidiae TaxID=1507808 RepID=A0A1V2R8I5_9GAMM|nr:ABC transporter ATP-binding protein [Pectobacterium actinidiae]QDX98592.1 ABC transporter ATP-binding protein [Pectobacterium carotovorum subsp. carotovorum]KHN90467.1 taurine-transporting ATPase [Pectobacterium actinidiae]MDY4315576.1 ABC transporter ATP-binding protein [Pectobacterium actinidiae]ONK07334.1 nitrate ABC transporter ATP-binding protein [Pectobacterium actinidiae]ONK08750.1 nitrate ABC transporter ATP-binding protein [Pectobacterium actinidiae]